MQRDTSTKQKKTGRHCHPIFMERQVRHEIALVLSENNLVRQPVKFF
jgi:hypothetical protein